MKSKKNVFAAVLTFVLALSIVTVSATAASANVKKSGESVNDSCIAAAEASGECVGQPLEGFVKNLSFLSEQEKSALLADLAEIEKYENQIKLTNDSTMKSTHLMKSSRRFSKETQSFGNVLTMSMMKRSRQTSRT